jgi:hypothetical protein
VEQKSSIVAVIAVLAVVGGGAGAVYLVTSGEQPSVADVERNPIPPERPPNLTAQSVREYVTDYEERRLYNDVLAAHSHRLQVNERVISVCRPQSVTELSGEGFEVELWCAGGLDNRADASRQYGFQYRVTYRVTETTTEQTGIQRYPYEDRDTLQDPGRNRSGGDSA